MSWLTGWKRRIPIIIDPTTVSGGLSNDVSNAPIMIKLSNSSGRNNKDITNVFDELWLDDYTDDFTGTNGSSLDPTLWEGPFGSSSAKTIQIYDNKARLYHNNTNAATYEPSATFRTSLAANSKFMNYVTTDFSSAVYYDVVTPGTAKGTVIFYAYFGTSGQDYAYVSLSWNQTTNHAVVARCYIDGAYTSANINIGTNLNLVDHGWLRIRRVGNTVYCDYDINGSGWTNALSRSHNDYLQALYYHNFYLGAYQVYIVSQTCDFESFSCDHSNNFSKKIAVTTSDGETQCPVEIDADWSANNEIATLWPKIPTIASGTNTTFYLYYNNEKADNTSYVGTVTSTAAKNVWPSNYAGVWHMSQNPALGASSIKDSTSNVRHGTPAGTMTIADLVTSTVGLGLDFDGTDDAINVGASAALNYITVEALIRADNSGSLQHIVSRDKDAAEHVWQLRKNTSDLIEFKVFQSDANYVTVTGTSDVSDGSYHYVVGSWDGATCNVYVDGILEGSTSFSGTLNSETNSIFFGRAEIAAPGYFDGIIDEVRISNYALTHDQIKLNYQAQFDDVLYFSDAEYYVLIFKDSDPSIVDGHATVFGYVPDYAHPGYIYLYDGSEDGEENPEVWDSETSFGLKPSNTYFNKVIYEFLPFKNHYYKWYTVYSGSDASECWSPTYSFYSLEAYILRGGSDGFRAVVAEPDCTFDNTKFAVVSYGSDGALQVINNDEVVGYWPSSVSGTGNTIKQDVSDVVSVR